MQTDLPQPGETGRGRNSSWRTGMKSRHVSLTVLLGTLFLVGYLTSTPHAFHSGGVAYCGGCHSMHAAKPSTQLLKGSDSSATCLSCHASDTPGSYKVATVKNVAGEPPLQLTPGGDFAWLKKQYTDTASYGAPINEKGETHGHNIVAGDTFGYVADTTAQAPGGTFSSAQLGCQSCHDPHGRARRVLDSNGATAYVNAVYNPGSVNAPIAESGSYDNSPEPTAEEAVGVYRLLRGVGDTSQGVTFAGVAIGVAPSTYNRAETATQTRVAYGNAGANTWGNWCGTCHPDMHTAPAGKLIHPVDASLTDVKGNYDMYVKSGDLTGAYASSFTSLVPFVENTGDITTLKGHAKIDNSYLNGPGSSDQVSCLTCHRAHASGFPNALRWQSQGEFIVYNGVYPGTDTTPGLGQYSRGRKAAENQKAYYDRNVSTFAAYQRSLCNKCHAKD